MKKPKEQRSFLLNKPNGFVIDQTFQQKAKRLTTTLLLSPNFSKGSTMSASPIPEFTLSEFSQCNEKFPKNPMRFLPYIYAQTNPETVKSILKSQRDENLLESLPLIRKQSTLKLISDKPLQEKVLRIKSLESFAGKRIW